MKGERRQSFWAADGTGYGWLAEEDTNRRKTDEKKEEKQRSRGTGDAADWRGGSREELREKTGEKRRCILRYAC